MRVGFPIGGAVQVASGFEAGGQLGHQFGLNQAPLVVAQFVPRVRKKHMDAVQTAQRHHVLDHLHRIVLQDADVGQPTIADLLEQGTHAGFMHLATQKAGPGHQLSNVGRSVSHAKANFQHDG